MKKPTSKQIWNEATKMAGEGASADDKLCAAMMICALFVGANRRRIAKHLKVSESDFGWMFDNLRRNGIFKGNGRISANWFDKEDGGYSFILDLSVGVGNLQRSA